MFPDKAGCLLGMAGSSWAKHTWGGNWVFLRWRGKLTEVTKRVAEHQAGRRRRRRCPDKDLQQFLQ